MGNGADVDDTRGGGWRLGDRLRNDDLWFSSIERLGRCFSDDNSGDLRPLPLTVALERDDASENDCEGVNCGVSGGR